MLFSYTSASVNISLGSKYLWKRVVNFGFANINILMLQNSKINLPNKVRNNFTSIVIKTYSDFFPVLTNVGNRFNF